MRLQPLPHFWLVISQRLHMLEVRAVLKHAGFGLYQTLDNGHVVVWSKTEGKMMWWQLQCSEYIRDQKITVADYSPNTPCRFSKKRRKTANKTVDASYTTL